MNDRRQSRLSERIDRLFTTLPKPDGSSHTPASVAAEVNSRFNTAITTEDIENLRSGAVTDVSDAVLSCIAQVFGFAPEYLTDDDAVDLEEQLELFAAMRTAGVPWVGLRRNPGRASSAERRQVISLLRSINERPAGSRDVI
ncbi:MULTISPECIES: hypothetical protein [Rhodococcus]|uniref:hypothetical protein n=1 Tax=Rhodococcus TaxID=1827 RepID=UPI001F39ADBE|nr:MULTISPECIES: hypothetical protein [Rhodococcus]MCF8786134.1 hypothetical protein [Rhodococcus ruber]UTM40286.1 hypothetical protein MX572_25605 [Rhodococcus pyridinivorans]WAL49733.1 hypothetical protein OQN32_27360 [Rhodococcus pyridinivorans]